MTLGEASRATAAARLMNVGKLIPFEHTHNRSWNPYNTHQPAKSNPRFACVCVEKEEKNFFPPNFLSLVELFAAFPHASPASDLINNSLARLSTRFWRRGGAKAKQNVTAKISLFETWFVPFGGVETYHSSSLMSSSGFFFSSALSLSTSGYNFSTYSNCLALP